jgi:hypothetical protein|tara:strand:+ start:1255 stop:1506 length:252 start_codon:yes stop_codon:yes gene_type:complete
MTKRELRELIRQCINEYTGTGSGGGNATDGNEIPSPRPFVDDEAEIDNYSDKNAGDGGQGMQTRGMEPIRGAGNMNRTKMTKY